MKMRQENIQFSSITITMETKRELKIFLNMMLRVSRCTDSEDERDMANEISDWLSNEVRL